MQKLLFSIVLITVPLALSAGMNKGRAGSPKIKEGRYFSARGNFSLEIPSFILKTFVEEESNSVEICARVRDEFGDLLRVDVFPLQEEVMEVITERGEAFLSNFFNLAVMSAFRQACPEARIVDQEGLELDNHQRACFFLVSLPEGSLLVDTLNNKKRFDSMRGALLFLSGKHLVVISYQTDITFSCERIPYDVQEVKTRYSQELVKSANSFRFEQLAKQVAKRHSMKQAGCEPVVRGRR